MVQERDSPRFREPLLGLALAFCAGILLGHFVYFQWHEAAIGACVSVALAVVSYFVSRNIALRLLCVLLAGAMAGVLAQSFHRQGALPQLDVEDAETVILTGCVVDPPVFSTDRERFLLELAPGAQAQVTVNLKEGEQLELAYGTRLEVVAKVRSPRSFYNPGEFNYPEYLAQQHIYWTAAVHGIEDLHPQKGRCCNRFLAALFAIRTRALSRLDALFPGDPKTASLLAAILLGQTLGLDRHWTDDFRLTGTYHALVISGQHVSVLALSLLFLLRLLNLGKIPALSVAAAGCWLYAFLSGMNSPAVRAAGGFTLFLLASYFFRRIRILNSLAAVALLYLSFDPDLLFDPSFQLSFLSAAAIAAFAVPMMQRTTQPLRLAVRRFREHNYDLRIQDVSALGWRAEFRLMATTIRLWTHLDDILIERSITIGVLVLSFVAEGMLVSACIQFALALPMVAYFHRLSVTAMTANVIVVPLLCAVVPCGFAAIVTGWWPLGWVTSELLAMGQAVATWHAHYEPGWRITDLPIALSASFAASLVLLAILIRRKSRMTGLASAASLALFATIYFQPWPALIRPGWLEVSGLDVSQGDSLLVVFPRGTTMLIDAGGFPGAERMVRKPKTDIGEDVVSPYLWWRRVQRLDYVVLTHGHSDHMGGLPAILDNFRPRELWTGPQPVSEAWRTVLQHAALDRTKVRFFRRQAAPILMDGTSIRILAPSAEYLPQEMAKNDDSLVLEIAYGKRTVLLTGDAEKPTEWDMLSNSLLHPVTFLKVGHHGSKTSSSEEFLSAVAPEFALISDGYKNQFHHPHPSVLARLAEHHVAVFRTDERGLVTFRTDGQKVELTTYH